MASTKLIVRVLKAQGHGVHGMFPHEEAWVEVWVASDTGTTTSNMIETQKRKGHPLVWNEEYELDIGLGQAGHGHGQGQGQGHVAVHVKLRGKMAGHEGMDDIGEGVCVIEKVCDCRLLNLS